MSGIRYPVISPMDPSAPFLGRDQITESGPDPSPMSASAALLRLPTALDTSVPLFSYQVLAMGTMNVRPLSRRPRATVSVDQLITAPDGAE